MDTFKGKEKAILVSTGQSCIIENFDTISVSNLIYDSQNPEKFSQWKYSSLLESSTIIFTNIQILSKIANTAGLYSVFVIEITNLQFINVEIKSEQLSYIALFQIEQKKGIIKIDSLTINSTSLSHSIILYIKPTKLYPLNILTANTLTISSSKFSNSQFLFGNGFQKNEINYLQIKDSTFTQSKDEIDRTTLIQADQLLIQNAIISGNTIEMQTIFGNNPSENALTPSFQFNKIQIISNNFKFFSSGQWININITNENQAHALSLDTITFSSNTFSFSTNFSDKNKNFIVFLIQSLEVTEVTIKNLIVNDNNQGLQQQGFLLIKNLQQTIVTFTDSTISSASCFMILKKCKMTLNNVVVTNSVATTYTINQQKAEVALLVFIKSIITLNSLQIIDSTSPAIFVYNSKTQTINLIKNTFQNINCLGCSGSGIKQLAGILSIDNSVFKNCRAVTGGAIYIENVETTSIIQNTIFEQNQCQQNGGAIAIILSNLVVNFCEFFNNKATLDGGAIFFQGSQLTTYKLELGTNLTFKNNTANAGAAVLYLEQYPVVANFSEIKFINNTGRYFGSKISSQYPSKIKFLSRIMDEAKVSFKSEFNKSLDYIDQNVTIEEISSSNLVSFNLSFQLFDEDDALIQNYDNYTGETSRLYLEIDYSVINESNYSFYQILGLKAIQQENDTYNNATYYKFANLSYIGYPLTQIPLVIKSSHIQIVDNKTLKLTSDYIFDKISLDFCECWPGQLKIITQQTVICYNCPQGQFSFQIADERCKTCPQGAYCHGEDKIEVNSGYWRPHKNSSRIVECQIKVANCQKVNITNQTNEITANIITVYNSTNNTNTQNSSNTSVTLHNRRRRRLNDEDVNNDFGNHLCQQGYIGYTCNDCDRYADYWQDKYYNSAQYTCAKCKTAHIPALISIAVLVVYVLFGLSVILPFISQNKASLNRLVFLKFLLNHFQIFVMIETIVVNKIIMDFKYDMNVNFSFIFQIVNFFAFGLEMQIASLDCFLTSFMNKENLPFLRIFFAFIVVLFTVGVLQLVNYIIQEIKKINWKRLFHQDNAENDPKSQNSIITGSDLLDVNKATQNKITSKKILIYSLVFYYIFTLPIFFKFLIRVSWCHELILDDISQRLKYLHSSPSVSCMTNLHILYILVLIVPAFVFYFIGLFVLLIYLLYKKKGKSYGIGLQFLYYEYKKKFYYWEFVRVSVRCIVQYILITYETQISIKSIWLTVILGAYLLFQLNWAPYKKSLYNQVDFISILFNFLALEFSHSIYKAEYQGQQLVYFFLLFFVTLIFIIYLFYYCFELEIHFIIWNLQYYFAQIKNVKQLPPDQSPTFQKQKTISKGTAKSYLNFTKKVEELKKIITNNQLKGQKDFYSIQQKQLKSVYNSIVNKLKSKKKVVQSKHLQLKTITKKEEKYEIQYEYFYAQNKYQNYDIGLKICIQVMDEIQDSSIQVLNEEELQKMFQWEIDSAIQTKSNSTVVYEIKMALENQEKLISSFIYPFKININLWIQDPIESTKINDLFIKDKLYITGYSFINVNTEPETDNKKFITFDREIVMDEVKRLDFKNFKNYFPNAEIDEENCQATGCCEISLAYVKYYVKFDIQQFDADIHYQIKIEHITTNVAKLEQISGIIMEIFKLCFVN